MRVGVQTLTRELLRNCDAELQVEVIHWAAHYEHSMQLGSKAVLHLEVSMLPSVWM
jgi:replication factor C subunit 3/5